MFIDESIPSEFNKIVEINDNYIVLSNLNRLNNDTDYEVYVQYINPSNYVLHLTDYNIRFKDSSYIDIDYNYNNNGYFNYLDKSNFNYYVETSTLDDDYITNSFWERSNCTNVLLCVFIIITFLLKILGYITSLADKESW